MTCLITRSRESCCPCFFAAHERQTAAPSWTSQATCLAVWMTGGWLGVRSFSVFSCFLRSVLPSEKDPQAAENGGLDDQKLVPAVVEVPVRHLKVTYAEGRVMAAARALREGQHLYNACKVDGEDIPKSWWRNSFNYYCVEWSDHQRRTAIFFDIDDTSRIQLYFCVPSKRHPCLRLCPIGDTIDFNSSKWSVTRVDSALEVRVESVIFPFSHNLQVPRKRNEPNRRRERKDDDERDDGFGGRRGGNDNNEPHNGGGPNNNSKDGDESGGNDRQKRARVDEMIDGLLLKVSSSVSLDAILKPTLEKWLNEMREYLVTRGVLAAHVPMLSFDGVDKAFLKADDKAWGMTAALVMDDGRLRLSCSATDENEVLAWTAVMEENAIQYAPDGFRDKLRIVVAGESDVFVEEDVNAGITLYANGRGKASTSPLYANQQPLGVSCKKSEHGKTVVFLTEVLEKIVLAGLDHVNADGAKQNEQEKLADISIFCVPRPTEEERTNATWLIELIDPSPFMLQWIGPEGKQLREYGATLVSEDVDIAYEMVSSASYKIAGRSLFVDTGLASSVIFGMAELLIDEFSGISRIDFAKCQDIVSGMHLETPARIKFSYGIIHFGTIDGAGKNAETSFRDGVQRHPFTYFPVVPVFGRIFHSEQKIC
jgi:hypothetical protein